MNDCSVEWNCGATSGQVLADGTSWGSRYDQLNGPTYVIVDQEDKSLIFSDKQNRRVMRWSRQSCTSEETTTISNIACNRWMVFSNICCTGLAMDDQACLYITDGENHVVRRYQLGENSDGTVVAGGNGEEGGLNQLNCPNDIFVDRDYSVYVSDCENNRVMKWMKDAQEGIVVAGGQGEGDDLTQLSFSCGVMVDSLAAVYVADSKNDPVMRWCKGVAKGNVIAGGNGSGKGANQLSDPRSLSFDRQENLYVADRLNHRVQRFNIEQS
ncbi:unnamed protein product [Rotaria sp. Silwood2]|nr:unnamed protein product [Rotaria sp. Silwood2]CAF3060442.1 unnamed protein product [Rotaria sp. Silwood2]CAF3211175.1 unnamed protein product [Rotaria sp. Silwood2]CAF4056676.1 unnamed protein product [Rotaria sp. Silwood2]CAF4119079.1 unnamed protein product [Rotaria sp. Silwood2]